MLWLMMHFPAVHSALIGYSAAVILLCGHAYTEHSGTGFGEPLLEAGKGTLASAKMLFKNGSVYSTIFSFVTVMAPLVGMTFLLDPMTFFQPSVFRYLIELHCWIHSHINYEKGSAGVCKVCSLDSADISRMT